MKPVSVQRPAADEVVVVDDEDEELQVEQLPLKGCSLSSNHVEDMV